MEGKEPEDPLIKTRAGIDQAGAAVKEYAPLLWGFYDALKEQGFLAREALELTKEFMIRTMFNK